MSEHQNSIFITLIGTSIKTRRLISYFNDKNGIN